MRAIGQIPHQIAAKAFLAGAALLASASVTTTRAHASSPDHGAEPHSEELAMVLPRRAFPEGDDLVLPRPLPQDVATNIRAVFRLQRMGAFAEAINSTTHLTDSLLLGEVEANRYLNPSYHPVRPSCATGSSNTPPTRMLRPYGRGLPPCPNGVGPCPQPLPPSIWPPNTPPLRQGRCRSSPVTPCWTAPCVNARHGALKVCIVLCT